MKPLTVVADGVVPRLLPWRNEQENFMLNRIIRPGQPVIATALGIATMTGASQAQAARNRGARCPGDTGA